MTQSPESSHQDPTFADVLVPRHLRRAFTYRVPAPLRRQLMVGSRVLVPFGPSTVQGVVIALAATPPPSFSKPAAVGRLKEILVLADEQEAGVAAPDLLELTRLVADQYLTPWGQCLRLALPPSTPSVKPSRYYRITDAGKAAVQTTDKSQSAKLSAQARELLTRLAATPRRKGLTLATLSRGLEGSLTRTLSDLTRRGLLQEGQADAADSGQPRSKVRRTGRDRALVPTEPDRSAVALSLPPLPSRWEEPLLAAFKDGAHQTWLLQAPWADRMAGYLYAGEEAISRHRTVLIISPDRARAEAIAGAARARWGERVALLHSNLAPAAREAAWHRIQAGQVSVVVGTRSAVFAPLTSLGLICVDQEDDPSLKEEQEPRYHARDVAKQRAIQQSALLLLGSAHPSLETW